MKKAIATLSALVMMAAMAVPFSAFAADNKTTVEFTTDAAYFVIIPATVDLTEEANRSATFELTGADEDTPPVLAKDTSVMVTLADAANGCEVDKTLHVKNTKEGSTLTMDYKMMKSDTALGVGDTVAKFDYVPGTEEYLQTVTFTEPTGTKYAGTFTDTLTFEISTEDAAAEKTITINGVNVKYHDGETWAQIAEYNDDVEISPTYGGLVLVKNGVLVNGAAVISPDGVIDPSANYSTSTL